MLPEGMQSLSCLHPSHNMLHRPSLQRLLMTDERYVQACLGLAIQRSPDERYVQACLGLAIQRSPS